MTDAIATIDTDALHRLARLLNDAARTPALHQRLLADPRAALAEAGLPVDDAVVVQVASAGNGEPEPGLLSETGQSGMKGRDMSGRGWHI